MKIDKKFDEIVAFAEIEKFLDPPVKHYSSGMYVRLAFTVAGTTPITTNRMATTSMRAPKLAEIRVLISTSDH